MKKIIIVALLAIVVFAFFHFELGEYLTLEYIKAQQHRIDQLYQENRFLTLAVFFLSYVVITGASLPGAAILTLAAGAIFGLVGGLILVSFASTIGASIAFLVSRYLFRDSVQSKFGGSLKSINQGIEKDGAFYLFALRLVPAFPFFVINLVMGLTSIRLWTFFWVSQLGMFAGTVVYVNAGTQLAQVKSASGIFDAKIILSFILLAMLPFIGKKIVSVIENRKAIKGYSKPDAFDTNLVVIGAGSAGLVTAYIAAAVKAKVTLIEKHKLGGDCLNYGCVPSKALIRSAKFMSHIVRSKEFGIDKAEADFDFAEVMERIQDVIKKIEPHDSVERYTGLGVDVVQGEAKITSPWTVEVNGETIRTQNIVVATGGRPFVPPIEGIETVNYYTSDDLWEMREKPKKLTVLGGGPIGSELTQAFARLGRGLSRMVNGVFQSFTTDHGLPDNVVYHIDSDNAGHLWLNTSRSGILRIPVYQFDELANGTRTSISPLMLGRSDGMRSIEGVGGFQPAGLRDNAGQLWFLTHGGAVVVEPNKITPDLFSMPIHIEEIIADSVSLSLQDGSVTVPYNTNRLMIRYTGLSFLDPNRIVFRHQLEGLEEDWSYELSEDGFRRTREFTRLSPGTYTFRVSGANRDGIWSANEATVRFIVPPPWWRTPWAFLGYVLVLCLGDHLVGHRGQGPSARLAWCGGTLQR
ncbi:MAG: FAD-dependent oxidoreductase, partial [Pseudomonadota bacterium]